MDLVKRMAMKLRQLRTKKKMSQAQLAEKAGISRGCVRPP